MWLIRWLKRTDRYGNPLPGAVMERIEVNGMDVRFLPPRWRIELVLAWYDFWVGVYVDRDKRTIYILPAPCIGVRVYWG